MYLVGSRTTVKPQPARSVAKQDVISGAAMQARIKALEKALERETRKRKREEEGRKTEQEQTKKSKKKAKKANKRAEGAEAAAKDAKAALAASESGRAGRSLKRREEDVGRKEEKLKAREAAVEGNEAKRGAVKKLEEQVKTLKKQQNKRAQELQESKDCTLQWEAAHSELAAKVGLTLFECRWRRDEMEAWGTRPDCPYPAAIKRLGMVMCMHEAPCSQLGKYIKESIVALFPALANMSTPNPTTCARWRRGLLVLSDLVAAWIMSEAETMTLHHDGTTKRQQKLGVAVVDCFVAGGSWPVVCGGVFTQKDGTAADTAKEAFAAAFERPQATLNLLKSFIRKKEGTEGTRRSTRWGIESPGDEKAGSLVDLLPSEEMDPKKRVSSNEVALVIMSDHAPTALAVSPILTDMFHKLVEDTAAAATAAAAVAEEVAAAAAAVGEAVAAAAGTKACAAAAAAAAAAVTAKAAAEAAKAVAAKASECEYEGSYDAGDPDHKRKGVNSGVVEGQQRFLEKALEGKALDPNEYGETGIMTMFYRQSALEFSRRGEVYEFGQGMENFPEWMAYHFPGLYLSRPSERGAHYDWHLEMSFILLFTFDMDLEYMVELNMIKPVLNKMEVKLMHLLGCMEIKSAVKAEAVMWIKLIQPLRVLMNDNDLNLHILDYNPIFLKAADLLLKWSEHGFKEDGDADLNVLAPTFDAFTSSLDTSKRKVYGKILAGYRADHIGQVELVEGDDTSTRLWADCFKDMAAAAYNKWCSFIKEHLPEGNHRETMGLGGAGELGDPDEEMKKHMRNVKGNVLAESVFGVGDRLISTVTNAGLATVAALAAAKMTQPMQWLDLRSTPALDALIFEFCNHQSTVRGREEIARTAAQVAARYKEKQTIKARSKEKAKAVYREHAILKALVDKGEFAANVPAMSKRLKEIGGNDTLTAAAKIGVCFACTRTHTHTHTHTHTQWHR